MTSSTDVPENLVVAQQEIRDLRQALESRSLIDQAKGLVRAWLCCDEDDAFHALTQASQHANVKVRTLAKEAVDLASNCNGDLDAWMARHVGPRGPVAPSQAPAV